VLSSIFSASRSGLWRRVRQVSEGWTYPSQMADFVPDRECKTYAETEGPTPKSLIHDIFTFDQSAFHGWFLLLL
jgi:hypothetical protein